METMSAKLVSIEQATSWDSSINARNHGLSDGAAIHDGEADQVLAQSWFGDSRAHPVGFEPTSPIVDREAV